MICGLQNGCCVSSHENNIHLIVPLYQSSWVSRGIVSKWNNLKGTFFCAQQAAILMKEQKKGSIVFISSVHSHECILGRSLYTASKGGINALMRALAIELGEYNIRSNCIIAGAIKTDRWDGLTEEQIAAKRANWPIGLESATSSARRIRLTVSTPKWCRLRWAQSCV